MRWIVFVLTVFAFSIFMLPFTCSVSLASQADITFHVKPVDDRIHPGEEKVLTLMIENEATLSNFGLNGNTSSLMKLLTIAKNLRVELDDSSAPFKVESSNPVILGDLPSGIVAKVSFRINVSENAKSGEYSIPVRFRYTQTTYSLYNNTPILNDESEVFVKYIKIKVERKDYDATLKTIESDLISGKEGIVKIEIRNAGNKLMKNCVALINTTPPLRPNPVAMMAYMGNLTPGEEKNVTFKIYVMDGALNQSYPANIILKFETQSGIPMSIVKTIGVNVEAYSSIVLIKTKSFLPGYKRIPKEFGVSGVKGFVVLSIENNGNDLDDVSAILKFETPLMHSMNSPYVGNFKKGEKKDLVFYIISSAPPGKYRGELILKYKNRLGDTEVSKSIPFELNVNPNSAVKIYGINPADVGVGATQSIKIGIKNTFDEPIKDVKLMLVSSGKTLIPVSSTSYIDSLNAGETRNVTFRLSVSNQASEGLHLFYLIEEYSVDGVHDLISVDEFPILIKSNREEFQLISISDNLVPDETGNVIIKFRNSGSETLHDAVLELDLSPPLHPAGVSSLLGITGKPQPSLYYLGTLKPGEEAVARFRIDVDKDAGSGLYPATLRVRYYDANGYQHISTPITVSIKVGEKQILSSVAIAAFAMISLAVIASAIFVRKRRKRES